MKILARIQIQSFVLEVEYKSQSINKTYTQTEIKQLKSCHSVCTVSAKF